MTTDKKKNKAADTKMKPATMLMRNMLERIIDLAETPEEADRAVRHMLMGLVLSGTIPEKTIFFFADYMEVKSGWDKPEMEWMKSPRTKKMAEEAATQTRALMKAAKPLMGGRLTNCPPLWYVLEGGKPVRVETPREAAERIIWAMVTNQTEVLDEAVQRSICKVMMKAGILTASEGNKIVEEAEASMKKEA